MRIVALNDEVLAAVEELMGQGEPYVRARTSSDYWLYRMLFSTTCPVALDDGNVVGVIIAMRSQDDPGDIYVQDVLVFPVKFFCSAPEPSRRLGEAGPSLAAADAYLVSSI
jgi:hypothetical protein